MDGIMKKIILLFCLFSCQGQTFYEQAPIDDVLRCCGNHPDSYVIFTRVVLPHSTDDIECTKDGNVFYKMVKNGNDPAEITLVCKKGYFYIPMKEDKGIRE